MTTVVESAACLLMVAVMTVNYLEMTVPWCGENALIVFTSIASSSGSTHRMYNSSVQCVDKSGSLLRIIKNCKERTKSILQSFSSVEKSVQRGCLYGTGFVLSRASSVIEEMHKAS